MGELGVTLVLILVYLIVEVWYARQSTRQRQARDPKPANLKERNDHE